MLAVDLDASLLDELASDRVEVRRHDLLSDQLPKRRLTWSMHACF